LSVSASRGAGTPKGRERPNRSTLFADTRTPACQCGRFHVSILQDFPPALSAQDWLRWLRARQGGHGTSRTHRREEARRRAVSLSDAHMMLSVGSYVNAGGAVRPVRWSFGWQDRTVPDDRQVCIATTMAALRQNPTANRSRAAKLVLNASLSEPNTNNTTEAEPLRLRRAEPRSRRAPVPPQVVEISTGCRAGPESAQRSFAWHNSCHTIAADVPRQHDI
jgi:hypothetical protein